MWYIGYDYGYGLKYYDHLISTNFFAVSLRSFALTSVPMSSWVLLPCAVSTSVITQPSWLPSTSVLRSSLFVPRHHQRKSLASCLEKGEWINLRPQYLWWIWPVSDLWPSLITHPIWARYLVYQRNEFLRFKRKTNNLCQLYHQNPSDFIYLNMWLLKDSNFFRKFVKLKKTAYVRNPLQVDLTVPEVILTGDCKWIIII